MQMNILRENGARENGARENENEREVVFFCYLLCDHLATLSTFCPTCSSGLAAVPIGFCLNWACHLLVWSATGFGLFLLDLQCV